jgi:hypothetical protein
LIAQLQWQGQKKDWEEGKRVGRKPAEPSPPENRRRPREEEEDTASKQEEEINLLARLLLFS